MNETIPDGYGFDDVPAVLDEQTEPNDAFSEMLETARLDLAEEPPRPEPALKVNDAIWGTLGNFSLIIAKAKAGKTFLSVMAQAAAIGMQAGCISGCLPDNKKRVLYFDTEQGAFHVWRTANRVLRLIGQSGDQIPYDVYKLRRFNYMQRYELINHVIETTPDIGLVIIDGIRDLVTSINDEPEATRISDWLLRLTDEHNIHVVTLLHQNKGVMDKNARGHLGSELVNKAETTLSVTTDKDADIRKVEADYSRDMAFEPFAFRINDMGLPELGEDYDPEVKSEAKRTGPESFTEDKHHEIVVKIFNGEDELSRSDLTDKVKYHYGGIGDSKAREFITFLIENDMIHKEGKSHNPRTKYTLKSSELKKCVS